MVEYLYISEFNLRKLSIYCLKRWSFPGAYIWLC